MTRKEMKKNARAVLKKHYAIFLLACILLGLMGARYDYSLRSVQTDKDDVYAITHPGDMESWGKALMNESDSDSAESTISRLWYDKGIVDVMADNAEKDGKAEEMKSKILGTSRGVFAGIVNSITQGKLYTKLFDAILTFVKEPGIALFVMVLLSVLLVLFAWMFFTNILNAVTARVFLEARLYKTVPYNRFLYFFAIRRWAKTAVNLFIWKVREYLWYFTVIGGFIKHFSYALVPYILCENPDMKAGEAINLSRKMMDGHKWELLKVELSFLGWFFLSACTFGLSGIFYSNPYNAAVKAEFYAEMRKQAKEKQISGSDQLTDEYLFRTPDKKVLSDAYADAIALFEQPRVESDYLKGWRAAFAKATSIVLVMDKDVKAVEKIRSEKNQYRHKNDCAKGEAYPDRLSPIPESQRRRWVHAINYDRYYSVWNIILMFFAFCIIGWCWEVSLHIIQNGTFVNRGMLHGPWIPIYGTGGILILVVLAKIRKYPVIEFISAIVLCGFLEYMTSYVVQLKTGKRWWDYTGYFLNLNGRICAEGLLVFGIMGMIVVYSVAPLLDHYLRTVPHKIAVTISLILLACFGCDVVYSSFHPNEGAGITDYNESGDTDATSTQSKSAESRNEKLQENVLTSQEGFFYNGQQVL